MGTGNGKSKRQSTQAINIQQPESTSNTGSDITLHSALETEPTPDNPRQTTNTDRHTRQLTVNNLQEKNTAKQRWKQQPLHPFISLLRPWSRQHRQCHDISFTDIPTLSVTNLDLSTTSREGHFYRPFGNRWPAMSNCRHCHEYAPSRGGEVVRNKLCTAERGGGGKRYKVMTLSTAPPPPSWWGQIHYKGQWKGLTDPENLHIFGLKWHLLRLLTFKGPKSLDFQGPTPSNGPCNVCCSLRINNKYIKGTWQWGRFSGGFAEIGSS